MPMTKPRVLDIRPSVPEMISPVGVVSTATSRPCTCSAMHREVCLKSRVPLPGAVPVPQTAPPRQRARRIHINIRMAQGKAMRKSRQSRQGRESHPRLIVIHHRRPSRRGQSISPILPITHKQRRTAHETRAPLQKMQEPRIVSQLSEPPLCPAHDRSS